MDSNGIRSEPGFQRAAFSYHYVHINISHPSLQCQNSEAAIQIAPLAITLEADSPCLLGSDSSFVPQHVEHSSRKLPSQNTNSLENPEHLKHTAVFTPHDSRTGLRFCHVCFSENEGEFYTAEIEISMRIQLPSDSVDNSCVCGSWYTGKVVSSTVYSWCGHALS